MVPSTSSRATIEKLRYTFATHGLPELLVSDNGTAFTSEEFKQFCRRNGIRNVMSSPYHPASNGLVERAVQTFKQAMKKQSNGPWDVRIANFLLTYRLTPHSTTGQPPAQMLMGRRPRSVLDLLRPNIGRKVRIGQERQKAVYDKQAKSKLIKAGDTIIVRDFGQHSGKWLKGKIMEYLGPVTAQVELSDGRVVRRHADHIWKVSDKAPDLSISNHQEISWDELPFADSPPAVVNPPQLPRHSG